MPEDLLLELETPAPMVGNLKNIGDLLRVVAREVGQAVESMKGSASLFENAWMHITMEVVQGRAEEMQAARPRLQSALDRRLHLLKQTHGLAKWLADLGEEKLPDPEVLLHEIAGIERLKTHVFDRWQTLEELEDLAARDYPLTTADLDQIGPHRRPPPSYYADQTKPF
jgi:hypothetical protein